MRSRIVTLALFAALAPIDVVQALEAQEVRGGWETTVGGVERIFEFRIRGDRVTGIYCTECDDATTLAFIDGTLSANGLSFRVIHAKEDGSTAFEDQVTGRLEDEHLVLSGRGGAPNGRRFNWSLHRDPRGPPPAPAPNPLPPAYMQPGPWELITLSKLTGVWMFGSGPNKQYFIIRRFGNTLRGVACGPCDNPYTMGALEDFYIQDYTLLFTVCHEDNGVGPLPYRHLVVAHIAKNEMRIDATQDNGIQLVVSATLLGPLSDEATAGAPR